jgi:hypothetical protein
VPNQIRVEGLKELRRSLKAVGDVEGSREYRLAGKTTAETIVIPGARARAAGISHHRTGRSAMFERAAGDLRPATLAVGAGVRMGRGFPGALGSEWGSNAFAQFNKPNRGGYFLWPTIVEETPRILETYGQAIDKLWDRG